MSLRDWLRNAWLAEHETSREEIADLLSVIDRDLHDCQALGLSADWQLNIAYNAALQVAIAGLAAEGYRTARESHHYRAIQALTFTLGLESTTISQLDAFRKKRNISEYERSGGTSEQEAREMIALAVRLREELAKWLKIAHLELVPKRP
jgi:hypothetical protein